MTDEMQASPAQETLRWVSTELQSHAAGVGLPCRGAPELASAVFNGGSEASAASIAPRDLPAHCVGLAIGRYHLLLGLLPEVGREEDVLETLRVFRNQCVVARSYIAPNAALDLQLFLVAPRGSEHLDAWHPLALLVERDERVARKHVWRRPEHSANDEASFADFVERSFLARPWTHEATFSMAPLGNVSQIAPDEQIPRTLAGEWAKLATELRNDPGTLVDELIAAWTKRGQI